MNFEHKISLSELPKLEESVRNLIELELQTPVTILEDRSIRIKITDSCGMACTFCHNEGTPVTIESQRNVNGRVSVFETVNGVDFISKAFEPTDSLIKVLEVLSKKLNSNEIHLTGGEPTLNPSIAEITRLAKDKGYKVKMTSNGETGSLRMGELADAGLESINFSIFGTTPEEIASVQSERFKNTKYGAMKLKKLIEAIESCIQNGMKPKANVVLTCDDDIERVIRIVEKFGNKVELRLLPSLEEGFTSFLSIYRCLVKLKAKPVCRVIAAGSSNTRTDFITEDGLKIGFKQINRTVLPETCGSCELNNDEDCKEGFYGIRLYLDENGKYRIGVCIQRMDLTVSLEEFIDSGVSSEVLKFREDEFKRLTEVYKNFIEA